MDYRHTAIHTLTDFAEEFSEEGEKMSFGEILYSITRNSITGLDLKDLKKFKEISDEQWYRNIEKAYKNERED